MGLPRQSVRVAGSHHPCLCLISSSLSLGPLSLAAALFLFGHHGSLLLNCPIWAIWFFQLVSFYELEDGAVVIGDQVKQITRLKIELVPVAQRELEIQAATDFLEGYYVHDYLQLPQKY